MQTEFFRSSVIWLTAGTVVVVILFLLLIRQVEPEATELLGTLRFILLGSVLALLGLGVYAVHVRSMERAIIHPLERIIDVTHAIVDGASNARIESMANAAPEVKDIAEAINKLAQKATHDIADLKKLERVRSEFLGNVSHELRTPIFSVQGYLETLLEGAIDDPNVSRQFLEKAYSNTKRLNALLSDLIDISRIESGELRLSFRFFDVRELITDVVSTMEHAGSQQGIALIAELPDSGSCSVFGDRERITQVITNLIDNALKYNVEGGTVTVSAKRKQGTMLITITDTGIGIPEDQLGRIFERFFRVDGDRSRETGGTGLGLAIVKHILEAHQAPVFVQSSVGVGTSIAFELKTA